ncbi:DUF4399 domain-containing protein [Streptomyces kutzneri]|uniref:DUF4399 domain-containing protein n=1 Tax=Streptomyces kutzneri TaxID=3051179 RepID=UPI0028D3724F|nr:DUF4399 domain-containing protein [Streptomyces sp. DSM 40907]
MARVYLADPQDGAVVANPFGAKFGVVGMALRWAGDTTPDSGFFTLLVDGDPVPAGQIIPVGDQALHFGKGQ